MLVNCSDNCVKMVESWSGNKKKSLEKYIRGVAGNKLSTCKDFNGAFSSLGISVNGSDEALSREVYLNSVLLTNSKDGSDSEILLSDDNACIIASFEGIPHKKIFLNDMLSEFNLDSSVGERISDDLDEEETGWSDYDSDYEDGEAEGTDEFSSDVEVDEVTDVEPEVVDEQEDEDELEEEVDESLNSNISKEDREAIEKHYEGFYRGAINVLADRYTALFSSGYEVKKPAGILSNEGILSLSGSKLISKDDFSIAEIYNIFYSKMDFLICEDRSRIAIADRLYEQYSINKKPVYFPFKLVEYAFGRKAPKYGDRNARTTYEKHSDASHWKAYCDKEVKKNLYQVIGASVVRYVSEKSKELGVSYKDYSIAPGLKDFIEYMKACLSICLLVVDYGISSDGSPYSFKIRVCDPYNALGDRNLTSDIIAEAFGGDPGIDKHSYGIREEKELFFKEYAHEFNHTRAQASPLFAYRAYLSIEEQGIEPDWNNLILGMAEDDTVLRNGSDDVSLNTNLTHFITAGSRAGKGVMTLNVLAGGIYSNKSIFYLDDKPDMASVFKCMSPEMFVVNGAAVGTQYDIFHQFTDVDSWINTKNVPKYVLSSFGKPDASWRSLGDIFYVRALKLVMGLIVARGLTPNVRENPDFGGKDGILLVVDEFKNFQSNYSTIIRNLLGHIPPINYQKELGRLAEEKVSEVDFNKSFNDSSFYALTYLNSLVEDISYMDSIRDADFNQAESGLSDVFVIGQNLEYGNADFKKAGVGLANLPLSERYKSSGYLGAKKDFIDVTKESFPYSLVDFKTADAFFGNNKEDGRERYLAQNALKSNANGRLDKKASKFAYKKSFSESDRKSIVYGNEQDNIKIANECTYFKPFLVLNDSIPEEQGGECIKGMFERCEENGISRKDIIEDNPGGPEGTINPAVGFEDYLRLMGIPDYKVRLAKSGQVANNVIRAMGYEGNWLDFITDLRPEWCFSVKDVAQALVGNKVPLHDPASYSVTEEFYSFNPTAFGASATGEDSGYVERSETSGSVLQYMDPDDVEELKRNSQMDDIFEEDDEPRVSVSPVSNVTSNSGGKYSIVDDMAVAAESLRDEFLNEGEGLKNVDPMDQFFGTEAAPQVTPSPIIREAQIEETNDKVIEDDNSVEAVLGKAGLSKGEFEELLGRLKGVGWNINADPAPGVTEEQFRADMGYGNMYKDEFGAYHKYTMSDVSEFNSYIEYTGSIDNKADLVKMVTKDIINLFGGLEEIVSFKVLGGSIFVNDCCYRCSVGSVLTQCLPLDLRREIHSGNISRLFDYSQLKNMPRLSKLEFDSPTFVLNYVSYGLGFGSSLAINRFFEDIPSLWSLKIGKDKFVRDSYMFSLHEADELLYQARTSTRLADGSERVLGNIGGGAWAFSKNVMTSKDFGKVMKILLVPTSAVIAGVALGSQKAIHGGRSAAKSAKKSGGLRGLGKSFKDVMSETKKF